MATPKRKLPNKKTKAAADEKGPKDRQLDNGDGSITILNNPGGARGWKRPRRKNT